MAGVNHKKVKQLIHQKVKTINDRQFFSSRVLAGHFADMAAVQTKRYGYNRKVKVKCVWEPKNPNLAFTEGERIWINAGDELVKQKKSRPERYELVCGLFAHELGHILFTDFLTLQSYNNAMASCRWYPIDPAARNMDEKISAKEIMDILAVGDAKAGALVKLLHHIWNTLEDGYIENKMLIRFPGVLGTCLDVTRKAHFESVPTLTELIEQEDDETGHIWLSIQQLILSYVKWGELKYGQEPLSDERVQLVFSMLSELDTALTNPSAKVRMNIVNIIAIRCWPYIKDFLEHCEQLSQNASASGAPTATDSLLSQLLSALTGGSQQSDGTTQPVQDAGDTQGVPVPMASGNKRAQIAQQATASNLSGDGDDDESQSGAAAGGGDDESESDSNVVDQLGLAPDGDDGDAESNNTNPAQGDMTAGSPLGGTQQPYQDVSKDETGRLPRDHTDGLYAPTEDGSITRDDDYTGSGYANAASDVEHLLENMAEQLVFKDLEAKRTREINELAKGISYGDAHAGIDMEVKRMAEVNEDLIDQYHAVAGDLQKISKKLQRSVTQKLQDKRRGGKMTNLLIGRRLDPHALPRNDAHAFYKSILPNEAPELALALLLDESGSMSSRDRATYARSTAVILYDFCQALKIPVMIYGHSTGNGRGVDMYSYAEFDSIDRNDCYRLMDISSRGSNRDGAPLRYVAEQLTKRSEEVKTLILVSDGQPNHFGYSGTAAEDDLRSIKQEYQRKGVLFVAAAIGDDKANIERIYGDAFLDITDLNKLPVMLTDVIKQHLRV